MSRKLNMIFTTTEGKNATISLANPREDLTRDEVMSAMEQIVAKDLFLTSGSVHLTKASDAVIKVTEEIALA
jgi:hypothetical protein